jgi:translation initiation factor IF-3
MARRSALDQDRPVVHRQLVPRLVAEWSKAKAQQRPAYASEASPAKAALDLENASTVSPDGSGAMSSDEHGEPDQVGAEEIEQIDMTGLLRQAGNDITTEAPAPQPAVEVDVTVDANGSTAFEAIPRPPAEARQSILAAFKRSPAPAQPAPKSQAPRPASPPPRPASPPPRPVERPWFTGEAQPQPREELSDAAVDELIAGWRAGNLAWPRRLLGEQPGHPDCRLSRETLRRNRLR